MKKIIKMIEGKKIFKIERLNIKRKTFYYSTKNKNSLKILLNRLIKSDASYKVFNNLIEFKYQNSIINIKF